MAAPVTKDQEVELDVESLAYGGNGVARLDGFVVFVRRGLPGDRVRARVTKVKRSHAEALATEIVRPGPLRVEAPCEHYPACGGCRFQDLEYGAQLAQKHAQVRDALQRIAGIAEPPLEEIVPCEPEIFHYRNKMEYSFTPTPDGPGSASTGRAAGTRCSTSASAGSRPISATGSATRSATGRVRKGSRPTRKRTAAATCGISSSAKAGTRARRSCSS